MKKIEVLLVEDDRTISYLQKTLLITKGVSEDIISFQNGEETLEYLRKNDSNNQFLILLDINMPVLDGWGFLKILEEKEKAIASRTCVIILTSSVDMADKNRAKAFKSVKRYMVKPLLDVTPIKKLKRQIEDE